MPGLTGEYLTKVVALQNDHSKASAKSSEIQYFPVGLEQGGTMLLSDYVCFSCDYNLTFVRFNDVWVLDMVTKTWSCPSIRGKKPSGRFGHSQVSI